LRQVKAPCPAPALNGGMVQQTDLPVLVVDDDPAVLNALAFALRAEGYAVTTCASSAQALGEAVRGPFCCLVIDYRLPDMDGLALIRALKRRGVQRPVVLITSNPDARCRAAAAAANAVIVEKPLLGDVLSRQIATLIQ
jgi:DNA-binding response OmpR family regulator